MSQRACRNKIANQAAFTLIELLLALSLFGLILLLAYQTLVSSALVKQRVSESIEQQSKLRAAYRTLTNALSSKGRITGDHQSIKLDLDLSDSSWLEGVSTIDFVIDEGQSLLAYLDAGGQASELAYFSDQAEFSYVRDGIVYRVWKSEQSPDSVVLSWVENSVVHRWQFISK